MIFKNADRQQSPETTDLERRVLAHERILQSFISYMSRTEPRFVEHLRKTFVEPMAMARHEHSYRDVDDYAEEFIRSVMRTVKIPVPGGWKEREGSPTVRVPQEERFSTALPRPNIQSDGVQLIERSGIWEVRVDGVFRGDYQVKEHALAAVAQAKLALQ